MQSTGNILGIVRKPSGNGGGDAVNLTIEDWQSETVYAKDRLVAHEGGVYRSEIDDNEDNEPTVPTEQTTGWEQVNIQIDRTVTATYDVVNGIYTLDENVFAGETIFIDFNSYEFDFWIGKVVQNIEQDYLIGHDSGDINCENEFNIVGNPDGFDFADFSDNYASCNDFLDYESDLFSYEDNFYKIIACPYPTELPVNLNTSWKLLAQINEPNSSEPSSGNGTKIHVQEFTEIDLTTPGNVFLNLVFPPVTTPVVSEPAGDFFIRRYPLLVQAYVRTATANQGIENELTEIKSIDELNFHLMTQCEFDLIAIKLEVKEALVSYPAFTAADNAEILVHVLYKEDEVPVCEIK